MSISINRNCISNTQKDLYLDKTILRESKILDVYENTEIVTFNETNKDDLLNSLENFINSKCKNETNKNNTLKYMKVLNGDNSQSSKDKIKCFFNEDINLEFSTLKNINLISDNTAQGKVFSTDFKGIEDSIIIKIPSIKADMEDILFEYYVGVKIFNEISKLTPNIMNTYGMIMLNEPKRTHYKNLKEFITDNNKNETEKQVPCLFLEKINGKHFREYTISEFYKNDCELIKTTLLQILLTSLCLSSKYALHGDLHGGNFYIIELEQPTILRYKIPLMRDDKILEYQDILITSNYLVKIIDFGSSIVYDNDVILTSSFKNASFKRNKKYYHPAIDICRVIYNLSSNIDSKYFNDNTDNKVENIMLEKIYNYISSIYDLMDSEITNNSEIVFNELETILTDDIQLSRYRLLQGKEKYKSLTGRYSIFGSNVFTLELIYKIFYKLRCENLFSNDYEILNMSKYGQTIIKPNTLEIKYKNPSITMINECMDNIFSNEDPYLLEQQIEDIFKLLLKINNDFISYNNKLMNDFFDSEKSIEGDKEINLDKTNSLKVFSEPILEMIFKNIKSYFIILNYYNIFSYTTTIKKMKRIYKRVIEISKQIENEVNMRKMEFINFYKSFIKFNENKFVIFSLIVNDPILCVLF